jgi:6-phosphofructokinase
MKIAVNTGGGDAPGLNAVIRGIVLAAYQKGWEVFGIKYGYHGLVDTNRCAVSHQFSVPQLKATHSFACKARMEVSSRPIYRIPLFQTSGAWL